MKPITVLLLLLVTSIVSSAQESMPADKLEKAVRLFGKATDGLKDLQLKQDPDNTKPTGIKGGGEIGLIAVPERSLTADSLAKAGKDIMPVGQLWIRGVVPAKDGKGVSNDKLRQITLRDGDKETRVQLYLIGAQRDGEKMKLVVFAKDKEPLLSVPLDPADSGQNLPIELAGKGEKGNEESAALILSLVGKFKATIPIRSSRD